MPFASPPPEAPVSPAPSTNDAAAPGEPDAFERAWLAARAVWPKFPISREAFLLRLFEVADESLAVSEHAADLYLALACLRDVPGAIEAFKRQFGSEMAQVVTRVSADHAFRTEALQVIECGLFVGGPESAPTISAYRGRAPLRRWLRVVVKREAVHLAKRLDTRGASREEPGDDLVLAHAIGPDLAYMRELYRAPCEKATRDAFATLAPRERTVLRMYVVDRMTLAQIGATYDVSHATAARWIGTARETLVSTARQLIMDRLRLSPSAFDSVAELVRSQIEVGVGELLAESRPGA